MWLQIVGLVFGIAIIGGGIALYAMSIQTKTTSLPKGGNTEH